MPPSVGIADEGGAQEFMRRARGPAMRFGRTVSGAWRGRALGEKVAASVAPIPFDEAIPQIDGTWLLKHHERDAPAIKVARAPGTYPEPR
jgi:hypothetical protein